MLSPALFAVRQSGNPGSSLRIIQSSRDRYRFSSGRCSDSPGAIITQHLSQRAQSHHHRPGSHDIAQTLHTVAAGYYLSFIANHATPRRRALGRPGAGAAARAGTALAGRRRAGAGGGTGVRAGAGVRRGVGRRAGPGTGTAPPPPPQTAHAAPAVTPGRSAYRRRGSLRAIDAWTATVRFTRTDTHQPRCAGFNKSRTGYCCAGIAKRRTDAPPGSRTRQRPDTAAN